MPFPLRRRRSELLDSQNIRRRPGETGYEMPSRVLPRGTSRQTADESFAEAEFALRNYFGVGGWVKDASPLPGFARSWSRNAV